MKLKSENNGQLQSVAAEIGRLHGELVGMGKTMLQKAIRVGELLCQVRSSSKGNWLKWLADNVPFSQKTAWRYMHCYERRAELVNVTNLSEAYALLLPPKQTEQEERTDVLALLGQALRDLEENEYDFPTLKAMIAEATRCGNLAVASKFHCEREIGRILLPLTEEDRTTVLNIVNSKEHSVCNPPIVDTLYDSYAKDLNESAYRLACLSRQFMPAV